MPEDRKQHRLEAWVDRELRALLQTDDVAIVRAYVMGLVRGIGFAGRQVCCGTDSRLCWLRTYAHASMQACNASHAIDKSSRGNANAARHIL